MLKIEKNYSICRCVCQSLLIEIADTLIQYINILSPDEIDQLDDNQPAHLFAIRGRRKRGPATLQTRD